MSDKDCFLYQGSYDNVNWVTLDGPMSFDQYKYNRTTHWKEQCQSAELKETYRRLDEMTGEVIELKKKLKRYEHAAAMAEVSWRVALGKC